jgi:CheY-like chemotaxis protein
MAVTILIADDVVTNRMLLRTMLRAEDCTIIEASDGAEALTALLEATTPVVGLIDWEMPKMDGIEVCRQVRLRSNAPPMYLLLVTVRNARQDVVLGLETGASDYVTKPFDRAELLARVKIGVGMVELQQMLQTKVRELREALEQVKLLSGFLPICSYCKKIRDDKNYWEQVESYITKHSEAKFSHGICPQCFEAHVKPELDRLELNRRESDGEPP